VIATNGHDDTVGEAAEGAYRYAAGVSAVPSDARLTVAVTTHGEALAHLEYVVRA
jgi:hypothetical protein